jgi:hypothetical protein
MKADALLVDSIIEAAQAMGVGVVIPPKSNRIIPQDSNALGQNSRGIYGV